MSSVSAVNPAVADLLQVFSKSGSASLSTALSSTAVQSALDTASPGDLVQLSTQALQLQQVAGLFGTDPGTSQPTTTTAAETFAQQEAATLFGTDLSTGAGTNTISLLG